MLGARAHAEIVDEAAAAGEQGGIFDTRDRAADPGTRAICLALIHGSAPWPRPPVVPRALWHAGLVRSP